MEELSRPRYHRRWDGGKIEHMMQIGVDSFVALEAGSGVSAADRIAYLLEEIELADRVGLDVFGPWGNTIVRSFWILLRR